MPKTTVRLTDAKLANSKGTHDTIERARAHFRSLPWRRPSPNRHWEAMLGTQHCAFKFDWPIIRYLKDQ
jgi:hypothetical protein